MGKEFAFKKEFSLEERTAKACRMREKYPDRIPPKRPAPFTRAKSRMLAQFLSEKTKANLNNYEAVKEAFLTSLRARPGASLHSVPGASTIKSKIMKRIYEGEKYLMRIHKDKKRDNCVIVFGQLHSTCMTLDSVEAACEQAGRILNMTIEGILEAEIMYALPDTKLHDHLPIEKGMTVYEAWVPVNVEAPARIQMGDLQRVVTEGELQNVLGVTTHEEAALAISAANGKRIGGKAVVCSWGSKCNPPPEASSELRPPAPPALTVEEVLPHEEVKAEG